MKYIQTRKLIKVLNKMIKDGEISRPVAKEQTVFDVEYSFLTTECASYNLTIKAMKTKSPIYGEYYTVFFNDPNHKLLDKNVSTDGTFTERNTILPQKVFNRLAKYRKRSR